MRLVSFSYRFAILPLLLLAFAGYSTAQKIGAPVKTKGKKSPALIKQDSALEQQKQAALENIRQQNWQNAAVLFEQIIANAPKEEAARYWLALSYFNLKRIDEADARLNELIGMFKATTDKQLYADSQVLSAIISAVRKDNAGAIEKLKKVIERFPGHFDANISLGKAYFGEKNLDKSIQYFSKAKAIRNTDLNARFYLATALENSAKYEEALAEYRGILQLDAMNPMGNLGLGILLLKNNGDIQEAIKALQNALKANGDLYEARVEMGKALIKAGRTEESLEHLNKAVELKPENPEPHFQLSIAYRKLGKKAEADEQAAIVKRIHESRRSMNNPQ